MTRLLCFILVLLVNVGFAEKPICRCYYQGPYISKIENLIAEYRETARSHCMNVPSPYSEKEERKYYRKYYEISDKFIDAYAMRYPDIYHNLLLFAEQVNVVRDSRCERIYNSYMSPGWIYNLAEKEEKIAKERKRYWENASICQKKIDECAIKITNEYVLLFENCIKSHKNLITFHDYGMLAYLNNNFEKSLELLNQVVENSEQTEQEDLDAKFYHNLGSVCIEVMAYDKAVKYLSKAIKKDPDNKSAYFDRALAYFETGEFDLAINDYLTSEPKSIVYIIV
jgi:tetratricopeptide (TPR) repeat protein